MFSNSCVVDFEFYIWKVVVESIQQIIHWSICIIIIIIIVPTTTSIIIIIIIIIIIHISYFTAVYVVLKRVRISLTQSLLIHCSAKNFLTIRHILSIPAFCISIYRSGQRLSSVELSCILFGIIHIVESTSGITQAFCSCHMIISFSFKSLYF